MSYTKGPWITFHCEGVSEVLPAMREGEIAVGISNEYDARLIAASPDLLAALKHAKLFLDLDGRIDMRIINEAIAKAEGR